MNEHKSLIINSAYNVVYKLLNVLFPLITTTYVSHILLADGVGKVASAQNVVQYFVIIASLGIPTYGTREIAKKTDSADGKSELFTELFLINLCSTVICTVVYYLLISHFEITEKILYFVVGINIILELGNVDWIYQGVEDYRYITLRSFIVKLLSLVLLVIVVRKHDDCWQYALVSCIATAGNNLFNLIHLRSKDIHFNFSDISIRKHLKPVMVLLCTSVSLELYTLLDTTMITLFCPAENVAYYNNAMKIVKMVITLVTAICAVLLPRLSILVSEKKTDEINTMVNQFFSILLFIFIPSGIGIIFIADEFVPILFGESFMPAVLTLRITALLIYALGFSNLFGTQILMPFGHERKLLQCTIVGALSNICLNLLLIPLYAQNGAAFASVISESIVTIMAFRFSSKLVNYKLDKRFVFTTILAAIVMVIYLVTIELLVTSNFANILLSVIGAIIIYISINLLAKNKICVDFIKLIRGKN